MRKDGEASSWRNGLTNRLRLFAFDWRENQDQDSECRVGEHPIAVSYAYQMDKPKARKQALHYAMGVSELCVLPDGQLLVLEREVFVPKAKIGAFCQCKLYLVNPSVEHPFDMSAYSVDNSSHFLGTFFCQL